MEKLTFQEKIFYGFVCNEKRVYQHWYNRFLLCGVDYARIRRVVSRIKNWYLRCEERHKEGLILEERAEDLLKKGYHVTAKEMFHEAAACFHVGQHFFYIDPQQKHKSLKRIHYNYTKSLSLYEKLKRPIRFDISFRGAKIPGYIRLQSEQNRPLVIFVNGMDNVKEIEQHAFSSRFYNSGFNTLTFDGPSQGEMYSSMEMIPD